MYLKKFVTLGGLLGMSALLGGGCADNRTSLYIEGIQGFELGGDCTFDASIDSDRPMVGHGVFDPQSGEPYVAPLIIGNQLVPQGDNNTLRPETSRIQLEGAVIEVRQAGDGARVGQAFTSYFSATVHPVDSSAPGVMLATIPLLPAGFALQDQTVYQVSIKVFGTTLGGKELESGEFLFPITARDGYVARNCPNAALEHPCGWAQDGYCYIVPEED